MIHFDEKLFAKAIEVIKEAYYCADIRRDLDKIEHAKANTYFCGGILAANQLDQELRDKYPTINVMLNIANAMRSNPLPMPQTGQTYSEEEEAISNLQRDYCGILCDTAVKKEVVREMKQLIRYVD